MGQIIISHRSHRHHQPQQQGYVVCRIRAHCLVINMHHTPYTHLRHLQKKRPTWLLTKKKRDEVFRVAPTTASSCQPVRQKNNKNNNSNHRFFSFSINDSAKIPLGFDILLRRQQQSKSTSFTLFYCYTCYDAIPSRRHMVRKQRMMVIIILVCVQNTKRQKKTREKKSDELLQPQQRFILL